MSKADVTTVDREKLLRAAKLCAVAADAKSPVMVFQSTLVRISADGCDLSATRGSVAARSVVGIEAKGDVAEFCVNAKRLLDVVAHMPEGQLQIRPVGAEVAFSSGAGRTTIKLATTPSGDFPKWTDGPTKPVQIDRPALLAMLRRVVIAASPMNVANGADQVRFDCDGERLIAWAIKGHVLGVDSMLAGDLPTIKASIHADTARAFISVLDASDEPFAGLSLGAEYVSVSAAGTTAIARATVANHLPWRQLIPDGAQSFSCDRRGLLDAVERAGMFSAKDHPDIVLEIDEECLRVANGERDGDGGATSAVEADGELTNVQLRASWRYLRDCIAGIDADRVDVAIAGPLKPIVFRPAGVADGQMYLISPMSKKGA